MAMTRRTLIASLAAALPLAGSRAAELVPVFESEAQDVPYKYRRREVDFTTEEPAGTVIVDPKQRWLFHVLGNGRATRYGVAVGQEGKGWSGEAVVRRKEKWPRWTPTKEHLAA